MRCLNLTEAVNHPDRLKWPLKRAGKRGENKWERISWNEAYDIIEEKVKSIKKDYGPESIIGMEGTGRNIIWQVPYITYAGFESPNYTLGFLSGDACYLSRNIPRKKHLKSPGSQKKSLLKQLVSTPKTNRQPSSGVLPSINR